MQIDEINDENESILYIRLVIGTPFLEAVPGKACIYMKYAIRFLVVAASFLILEQGSYVLTKQAAYKAWEQKDKKETLMVLPPKSESAVRITAQMDIILEEYDDDANQLIFARPYWDVRLAGMDEEELSEFLSDPSNLAQDGDYERGYYACEIKKFDRIQLCIRKRYKNAKE